MSSTDFSMIRSVLTEKDLESFVETYKIPERFSPTLPGPGDSAECTPDRIVLYTLSFSSCGVRYPLSPFKVNLLRHFKVHFSQLHHLGFMMVVHFELSCVEVSGEPSIPLFCMFYKLISDADWFTLAKRKDSVSQPCYSFMPTSTYPKEWKSRFIFVSAAMIPESPPLRDAKAPIEYNVPILPTDEIVQWKRMYENPTRAFTFPEGVLAMGGLSPFYSVRPKSFFGKKGIPCSWKVIEGSVQAGYSAIGEKDEDASSSKKKGPIGSLQVRSSSDDDNDEDLESRLGSSHAPIEIPTTPSSSRVWDKTPEVSPARIIPAFQISPHHATGTSKPSHFEGLPPDPLAPLFADALPVPYIPKWKITQSSVVGTPETAWDFLAHAGPPSHRFMNSALRDDLFNDQYSMSLCEGLFRGFGMLQRADDLRKENEGLKSGFKTSQTVSAELRCQVVDAERKLQQEKLVSCWSRRSYAEWGITSDDNQKLAKEKAYRDVGYQAGLKERYAYSAQGLGRKETPFYNPKAKKRLSKLDKEFECKTPALLEKILERPLMSIDELKSC
ncbi:hypothetical protein Hdeb2414_s0093g00789681 [Helianthus debilis subsp. tardiflorus]